MRIIAYCSQCSWFSSRRHRTDRARGRKTPWESIISRVEATFQNSRIQKQESACSQERRRGLSRHCRVFKSEARVKFSLEEVEFGALGSRKRKKKSSCIYPNSCCMSSCIFLLLLWVTSSCIYNSCFTLLPPVFLSVSLRTDGTSIRATMEGSKALQDALASNDPVEIRKIRGSQAGQLTRKLNQIKEKRSWLVKMEKQSMILLWLVKRRSE